MAKAQANGATIYYTEQGHGLPVILVHGFPLDHRIWKHQVDALSRQYRVIAPDLPGFGQSGATPPFSIQSLAETLHHFARSIDACPFVLGGLSMGGYVALAYAVEYPTDLKGLMLIDTRCEADTMEAKENRLRMIDVCNQKGPAAIADLMVSKMLAPGADAAVRTDLMRIMQECPSPAIVQALQAMHDRADYRDKLASIAVPTLVIVGESDAITPPDGAIAMSREIPQSKVCVIHGAGHLAPMERPEKVNAEIAAFLGAL